MGYVGGFHDAIALGVEFIMGFYSGQFFLVSLVKSLFKVDSLTNKHQASNFEQSRQTGPKSDQLSTVKKKLV